LQPESNSQKKRLKVILETSVLIASSVYIISTELKSKVAKDEHYERAEKLVSELRKRVAQRIGVHPRTILRETRNALRGAIENCLEKQGCTMLNPSFFLNQCGDRLERTVELLSAEPVDPSRKDYYLTQVWKMYSLLLERASLVTEQTTRAVAEQRTRVTATPKFWTVQSRIQTGQVRQEMRQLYNLRDNAPSTRDYEILAEAAALYESYSAEAPTDVYIASADSSHFSPYRSSTGFVSDQITQQIEETLHVRCDWPDAIAEILSKLP
jgi:hypothetical protein